MRVLRKKLQRSCGSPFPSQRPFTHFPPFFLLLRLRAGMGNIMESMKKAQEIAKQAEVVNKELMETKVSGKDPSGQVKPHPVGQAPPCRGALPYSHPPFLYSSCLPFDTRTSQVEATFNGLGMPLDLKVRILDPRILITAPPAHVTPACRSPTPFAARVARRCRRRARRRCWKLTRRARRPWSSVCRRSTVSWGPSKWVGTIAVRSYKVKR